MTSRPTHAVKLIRYCTICSNYLGNIDAGVDRQTQFYWAVL